MDDPEERPFVQSLARGLAVIRAFDADHRRMTVSELAARTALSRATARRLLHTLVDLGYVVTDGRHFDLTPRVLELGFSFLSGLGLPELVAVPLEELSRQTGESTSASVLDGTDIVYIARVPVRRIMTVGITIGTRFPAAATSMGRVMLASQPDDWWDDRTLELRSYTDHTVTDSARLRDLLGEVREQGWCLVDQELELGLRSIAAPIRNGGGAVVGAINIATTTASVSLERVLDEFRPRLLRAAETIEQSLRHTARGELSGP